MNADSGYQGIDKDFPSLKSRIPVKRKRGNVLEKKDKRYNKKLNRTRVVARTRDRKDEKVQDHG